jgi:squalene cyclase
MESAAIDFLLTSQAQDGGWGYLPNHNSTVESSSSVIIALQNQPNTSAACDRAVEWLIKAQNKDGGWGISLDDRQSGWQTAWALLALARYKENSVVKRRTVEWLLSTEPFYLSE